MKLSQHPVDRPRSGWRDGHKSERLFWVSCGVLLLGFFAFATVDAESRPSREASKEAPQDQPKPSSGVIDPDLDLAHWSTLKNKYGWTIRYPKNWVPDSGGDTTAETSGIVDFSGPWD